MKLKKLNFLVWTPKFLLFLRIASFYFVNFEKNCYNVFFVFQPILFNLNYSSKAYAKLLPDVPY